MDKRIAFAFVGVLLLGAAALLLQDDPQRGVQYIGWEWESAPASESEGVLETELTVYSGVSGGLALVKETRSASLVAGANALSVRGVTNGIDATSIYFHDLTGQATILEQNYDYDLVSEFKLLQKFVGETVTIETESAAYTGTLLSASKPLLIETDSGVRSLNDYENVVFPDTRELITEPTINWLLDADAGEHEFEIGYLSSGLDWHAEYVAVTNEAEDAVELQAWVSVENNAGKAFEDAQLKLVAGDVHTISEAAPYPLYEMEDSLRTGAAKQFTEESFSEYHLYSMERPTTLKNNEVKQLSLFEEAGVPVEKTLVFEPSVSSDVRVTLEFENAVQPMPAGKVRVYKPDSDGQLQFLGEDSIDHTPVNEDVEIYVGNSFDVVAERTQTEYDQRGDCVSTTTFEVSVRNHKDEAATVKFVESSLWGEWKISSGTPYEKEDAYTAVWTLPVQADGEAALTYSVETRWC